MKKLGFLLIAILLTAVLVAGGCAGETTTTTVTATTTATVTTTATATTTVTSPTTTPPTQTPVVTPSVSHTVPAFFEEGVPVNNAITALFSEAMAPASVNVDSFKLFQGTTQIAGTVGLFGTTAVFTPSTPLSFTTVYTARITTAVTTIAGKPLAEDYSWSFTTGGTETIPPEISSTNPDSANPAIGIPTNNAITVTFSVEMNPASITASSILLKQGTTPIAGTVSYDGVTTAVFKPNANLAPNTVYTATVTTEVENLAGVSLAQNYIWEFTTGGAQTHIPEIIATYPTPGGIAAINSVIAVTFSEGMDPLTINDVSFMLWKETSLPLGADPINAGLVQVPGVVMWDGVSTATFTPLADLEVNTTYSVMITTAVTDLAGIHLATDAVWSFITVGAHNAPPVVTGVTPVNGATGVAVETVITVTFDESMDTTTISSANFTLETTGTRVPATVTFDGLRKVAIYTSTALLPNTVYTVRISGATDLAGNMMTPMEWSFTTAP